MPAQAEASACGAVRIHHIAPPTLWLQKIFQDGKVVTKRIAGNDSFADLGTKQFGNDTLVDLTSRCGFVFLEGKISLALKTT